MLWGYYSWYNHASIDNNQTRHHVHLGSIWRLVGDNVTGMGRVIGVV